MNTKLIVPQHVAVIMDGNGRWAEQRGLPRVEGHKAGALSVRRLVEEARRMGIRYLTLYSFSTENWKRAPEEVGALMSLFHQYLQSELPGLIKNGIRLRVIGDLRRLPFAVRRVLSKAVKETARNEELDLVLAISYGGRDELVFATKKIAAKVAKGEIALRNITSATIDGHLWTAGVPDPDLLIRTSGEMRVSNFLLWQIAYSEIIIVPEYWPEFDSAIFHRCLEEYSGRERRFGLTGAQLSNQAIA